MRHLHSSFLALVLSLISSISIADELDLAALTCANDKAANARWNELGRQGQSTGDGSFFLEGRFTFGTLCVENASVTGSFGVLVIIASVCDAKPEALLAFVRSRYPELEPAKKALSTSAGVIASYQSPKRAFALYRGRISQSKPQILGVPKSHTFARTKMVDRNDAIA